MTFETEQDRIRKTKAIEVFCKIFDGSYQKLGPNDIDFKVFDKDNNLISYAVVNGLVRTIRNAYPLPVEVKRLVKLLDKRLNPVVIWCCEDGILYGKLENLRGDILYNNHELMAYFDKQKEFKYVRF